MFFENLKGILLGCLNKKQFLIISHCLQQIQSSRYFFFFNQIRLTRPVLFFNFFGVSSKSLHNPVPNKLFESNYIGRT